jgi:hypothetical protein
MRRSDRKVSIRGVFTDPQLAGEGSAFKHLWTELVQRCLRAEKALEVSPAQYKALIVRNCAYCDTPPLNMTKFRARDNFAYNGVDRVDNTRGYTPDNLVPCCKLCNQFKSKLSADAFIEHAEKIVAAAKKRRFTSFFR